LAVKAEPKVIGQELLCISVTAFFKRLSLSGDTEDTYSSINSVHENLVLKCLRLYMQKLYLKKPILLKCKKEQKAPMSGVGTPLFSALGHPTSLSKFAKTNSPLGRGGKPMYANPLAGLDGVGLRMGLCNNGWAKSILTTPSIFRFTSLSAIWIVSSPKLLHLKIALQGGLPNGWVGLALELVPLRQASKNVLYTIGLPPRQFTFVC